MFSLLLWMAGARPWEVQNQVSLPVLNLGHAQFLWLGVELALGKPGCGTESTLLPGWLQDLTESTRGSRSNNPPLPHTEHGSAAWEVGTSH